MFPVSKPERTVLKMVQCSSRRIQLSNSDGT